MRPRKHRQAGGLAGAPLFAQIVALLFGAFALIQIAGATVLFLLPPPRAPIVHLSQAAEALGSVSSSAQGFDLRTVPAEALPTASRNHQLELWLAARLHLNPDAVRVWRSPLPGPDRIFGDETTIDPVIAVPAAVAARQADGRWRLARKGRDNVLDLMWRVGAWIGLTLVVIAPVAFGLARRLTQPVASFAAAAERLGQHPGAVPLPIAGPREVRAAIGAFNTMQRRIASYVSDRVRLVGAIAHDLRTPLTRLKLQIEHLPPPVRARAVREISVMERMIETTLVFVKDLDAVPERNPVHLVALAESVLDDLLEMGIKASLTADGEPVALGDELALRRMLINLIDNAVKYGAMAHCAISIEAAEAVIRIEDEGPGLPTSDLERVFEPFARGEASRSLETGGIGLGLSIVRTVVRAHGGEVKLLNRPNGGLAAEVRLPLFSRPTA